MQPKFKLNRIASSLVVAGLYFGGASLAMAAEEPAKEGTQQTADDMEVIEVTGYRASLNRSMLDKRAAVGSKESIMAEDIGKFPDLNVAEALQRIPGITITREAGEGRQVSLRGLGPSFTRVTINGMDSAAATGGSDASGSVNTSRAFDFNIFASELFKQVDVYKTPEASRDVGLAGAINMRTARPFDFDGFKTALSLKGAYSELPDKTDPRASFLISDTFADDTLGALLSVAYSKRSIREEGHTTVRWQKNNFSAVGANANGELNGSFYPRFPRATGVLNEQKRLGVTASFQYRPSDKVEMTLDVLHAELNNDRDEYQYSAPLSKNTSQITPVAAVLNGDEIVAGKFEHVSTVSEYRRDRMETDFDQYTFNTDWQITDDFKANILLGYGDSTYKNPLQNTVGIANNDSTFSYSYASNIDVNNITNGTAVRNMDMPNMVWGFDTTDPNNYVVDLMRVRSTKTDNSNKVAEFNFTYLGKDDAKLHFGAGYRKYEMEFRDYRNSGENNFDGDPVTGDMAHLLPLGDYGDGLDPTYFPNASNWLTPNYGAFMAAYMGQPGTEQELSGQRSFGVSETIYNAYAQFDNVSSLFGKTLRYNFGVRVERTKTTSDTYVGGDVDAFVNFENFYTDVLPSANFALDLTDQLVGRFSMAKAITRPSLGSLAGAVNPSSVNQKISSGNPKLEPFRANQIDLGLEWYGEDESMVGASVFYKDIEQWISSENSSRLLTPSEVTEYNLDTSYFNPATDQFAFTNPVNSPGFDILGYEFIYQQPFSFLPGFLKNFGVVTNFTYVDAKTDYEKEDGVFDSAPITGLSKISYNATLYYETDVYGARLSYNYRDKYLNNLGTTSNNGNDSNGFKDVGYLDFSAFYNINDNLSISLEAINLTDEYSFFWVDRDAQRPYEVLHTGRQYFLGLRASF
ncbi:TonB-dependent receptor [Gallaecimonas pentaromativorans]|uniref:TonB-dependent receptor n=1 Tax=Gallaecimonas pentaromativorans TaxID=584787 RepID=A0A3N1PDR8_9GAMM|nr:TonB-dependent receptor [Gallaecimonas pentaromativorans]MED5525174.1 TonB-dependent receptor [Pseudomonadota bacterium]ROQ25988.1 TonB-dependent receptor [Gallaecimonas pentaromativorans]